MIKELYVVYILRSFFCSSIGCDFEKDKSESILHHLKINLQLEHETVQQKSNYFYYFFSSAL